MNRYKRLLCSCLAAILLAGCSGSTDSKQKDDASSGTAVTDAAVTTKKPAETEPESEAEEEFKELYDVTPISQAYLNGDTTGLDDMQLDILHAARRLVEENVREDMTDLEKELALHDAIARTVHYDFENLGVFGIHSEHSPDPYGALIEHRAICSGYATSFKLLMDMVGIECEFVHALANDYEEHAWNLVKLEDDWYAVDVTWDDADYADPDTMVAHDYFNTNDEYLRQHSHIWDSSEIRPATGQKYSYANYVCRKAKNKRTVKEALNEAIKAGATEVILLPEGKLKDILDDDPYDGEGYQLISDCIQEFGMTELGFETVKTDQGEAVWFEFEDSSLFEFDL